MPLPWPPQAAGSLSRFPSEPSRNQTIHRVWRHVLPDGTTRDEPWRFASVPDDPKESGRYDLPSPMGACYTATRPIGAVLEALQSWLTNLPAGELLVRRQATVLTPAQAPTAAKLTAQAAVGEYGVTAALWAGVDRPRTQAWAAAFRRDGWWALYGGIQHDPTGRLRGHTLFDHEGAHPPTYGDEWPYETSTLIDDEELLAEMAAFGVHVREPGDLPYVEPPS